MDEQKCVFYGKSPDGAQRSGMARPYYGNQCGQKSGFSPCEMEVFWKQPPDWSKCLRNPGFIQKEFESLQAEKIEDLEQQLAAARAEIEKLKRPRCTCEKCLGIEQEQKGGE